MDQSKPGEQPVRIEDGGDTIVFPEQYEKQFELVNQGDKYVLHQHDGTTYFIKVRNMSGPKKQVSRLDKLIPPRRGH